MEGGRADYEVFKGYGDAIGGLFAFDLASELGDCQGHWMDDQIAKRVLTEDAATLTGNRVFGSIDTVCQLDDADGRDSYVCLAQDRYSPFQNVLGGVAATFTGDQDAGVQYQTQAIRPTPICQRVCGCG